MSAERFQLAIAGEGRGVAVADLSWNGRPDLVVSCGNDGATALVNRGNPGGHSFSVKLRGDRGNADAVGARSTPPHLGDRRECRRLARGNPMNRGKSSPRGDRSDRTELIIIPGSAPSDRNGSTDSSPLMSSVK